MFREKIKMAMGEQGLRTCKVSADCCINSSNLSTFLNGQRGLNYEQLERLVAYLGLTLAPKKGFHFHSDYMEEKEKKRQERIAAKRNE